jgi:hypothetical protein
MGLLKNSMVLWINLAIAFFLELCLLVIFGYWGVAISQSPVQKIALGASLPILLAVIWGIFLAPNSSTRLGEPWLLIAKLVIFSLAVLALFSIGKQTQAAWFAGITLINLVLLYI